MGFDSRNIHSPGSLVEFALGKRPKYLPPTTEITLAFRQLEEEGFLERTKSSFSISESGKARRDALRKRLGGTSFTLAEAEAESDPVHESHDPQNSVSTPSTSGSHSENAKKGRGKGKGKGKGKAKGKGKGKGKAKPESPPPLGETLHQPTSMSIAPVGSDDRAGMGAPGAAGGGSVLNTSPLGPLPNELAMIESWTASGVGVGSVGPHGAAAPVPDLAAMATSATATSVVTGGEGTSIAAAKAAHRSGGRRVHSAGLGVGVGVGVGGGGGGGSGGGDGGVVHMGGPPGIFDGARSTELPPMGSMGTAGVRSVPVSPFSGRHSQDLIFGTRRGSEDHVRQGGSPVADTRRERRERVRDSSGNGSRKAPHARLIADRTVELSQARRRSSSASYLDSGGGLSLLATDRLDFDAAYGSPPTGSPSASSPGLYSPQAMHYGGRYPTDVTTEVASQFGLLPSNTTTTPSRSLSRSPSRHRSRSRSRERDQDLAGGSPGSGSPGFWSTPGRSASFSSLRRHRSTSSPRGAGGLVGTQGGHVQEGREGEGVGQSRARTLDMSGVAHGHDMMISPRGSSAGAGPRVDIHPSHHQHPRDYGLDLNLGTEGGAGGESLGFHLNLDDLSSSIDPSSGGTSGTYVSPRAGELHTTSAQYALLQEHMPNPRTTESSPPHLNFSLGSEFLPEIGGLYGAGAGTGGAPPSPPAISTASRPYDDPFSVLL